MPVRRLSGYCTSALILVLLLVSGGANAQLIELGRGVDIQETDFVMGELKARLINPEQLNFSAPEDVPEIEPPSADEIAWHINERLVNPQFPLETELRYSQDSTVVEVDVYLQSPMCIVGTNEGSIAWIEKNKQRLIELNALCVVADAKNKAQLTHLQEVADPIPVITIPIDEIARLHNIQHYPVLIMGTKLSSSLKQP